GAFGLSASWPVLIAMAGLEFALATGVVVVKATPLLGVHGVTGFEEDELLAWRDDEEASGENRYERDVASLVREARPARVRPSSRALYRVSPASIAACLGGRWRGRRARSARRHSSAATTSTALRRASGAQSTVPRMTSPSSTSSAGSRTSTRTSCSRRA